MLKKTISFNCVVLSCVLVALLFVEGGYSKRFKPAKHHPGRDASNVPKRPEDNGEFEVYYTTPGGKRIGCTGLFSVEGKEEVNNIFVEDNRGRQRINTAGLSMALRQSFLPNFSAIAETIRRYAFLPVICLLPVLKPIAGVLGMNLDVDLLNMDNILSFNVNASTGIEVEASASFACPRGPPGPPGRAGFTGPPGYAGPPGPDGTNGTNGVYGRKGPPGEMGPPGSMGLIGYPGLQGTIGLPGPVGPPGEDGRDGRDGLPGAPGSRGATGADGAYGVDGTNGRDGRTGPQGPPGGQGAQGLPGKPGLPGTPGPNGIPGASGINGRPGLPGIPALDGLNAVCPAAPFYAMNSDVPSKPGSDGCSFIEVNKKELLKGSVTIGGGGGGGGGDVLSGPGGSGGSAQGVGIADAGSTGLGFYICNSKNLTFTISIDNNSDTIAINDSKTAEEEYGEKFPMNFDEFTKSSGQVKVNVDADGLINITPLGKTEDMYTFTRHSGVRPRSGFPIY